MFNMSQDILWITAREKTVEATAVIDAVSTEYDNNRHKPMFAATCQQLASQPETGRRQRQVDGTSGGSRQSKVFIDVRFYYFWVNA